MAAMLGNQLATAWHRRYARRTDAKITHRHRASGNERSIAPTSEEYLADGRRAVRGSWWAAPETDRGDPHLQRARQRPASDPGDHAPREVRGAGCRRRLAGWHVAGGAGV